MDEQEQITPDHPLLRRAALIAARLMIVAQAFTSEIASAECSSLVKGAIAFDVQSCGIVKPEAFDLTKPNFKFVADLDAPGRAALLNQYRGLMVKGLVVRSQAARDGLNPQKGALQGDSVLFFIPPGADQCPALLNKRVAAMLQERCCDGNGDAPCLLGTGMTLSQLQVTGEAMINAEGKPILPGKNSQKHGKEYKEAEKLYSQKKYKQAVALWQKADTAGDMDVKGLYRWGLSLRELEDCHGAVKPLKRIYDLSQQGKIWADQELDSRRGIFLLARCHAKLNEPSNAVFYLNGFLLEPKKYRAEIKQSLVHKDFGWIHTSKEYVDYKRDAQKRR